MLKTKNENIQAAVFDLDGVLMDSEWIAFLVWKEWVAKFGVDLYDQTYPDIIGLSDEETAYYCMNYAGITFDVAESCRWAWERAVERQRTELVPMPGAVSLVQTLHQHGFPLAIASNSPAGYIVNGLTSLGLLEYFPVRVGVDQVENAKPAPDVYLKAAEALNVHPSRCLAIEDSKVGVQAAAAAGMRVIAVPSPHDSQDAFGCAWRIYKSLLQVQEHLAEVLE
jgi:HAD superfamily hydrolase (TIGR01509 family)